MLNRISRALAVALSLWVGGPALAAPQVIAPAPLPIGTTSTPPTVASGAIDPIARSAVQPGADLSAFPVTATGGTAPLFLSAWFGERIDLKGIGAKGNAITLLDGTVAAGSTVFTSATATFTAADVGKSITVIGAGASGANLTTTIAAVSGAHAVTLATPASTAVSPSNSALTALVPVARGAGYAPGDTFPIAGGTAATQAVGTVVATTVGSASVNTAGSGGTAGACVLTGTTGTGTLFRVNATIVSGAISALGSILDGGFYTANPSSLSAEPVTSNCGLTGAKLAVGMGVGGASASTPGLYSAQPLSPVAQASTSGSGSGATFTAYWTAQGSYTYGNDDSAALATAVSLANSRVALGLPPACIYAPSGKYLIKTSPGLFSVNGCITGDGPEQTTFVLDASFAGDLFSWSDPWTTAGYGFLNQTISFGAKAGPIARGFDVVGNRAATGQQNALLFYDHADLAKVEDIDVNTLPGRALYSGVMKNDTSAYLRESRFSRIRAFNSGAAGVPVIEFTSQGTGDASNEVDLSDVDEYGSYGPSFVIRSATAVIRDFKIDRLRIEGKENNPANVAADLLDIGDPSMAGQVQGIGLNGLELIDPYGGYAGIRTTSKTAATEPYNIVVNGSVGGGAMQPGATGISADAGRSMAFHFPQMASSGPNVNVGATGYVGIPIVFDGLGLETGWSYVIASTAAPVMAKPAFSKGNPFLGCIDLTTYINAATQICSGQYGFQSGAVNTTSGFAATSLGYGNLTSGSAATSIGQGNTSSNVGTIAMGQNNTASGSTSAAIGYNNRATGYGALAFGSSNTADGTLSTAVGGQLSAARGRFGVSVYAAGDLATAGDAQQGVNILRGAGASASAIRLTADGSAAGGANVVNLPSAAVGSYSLRITLTALDTTTPANTYSWSVPIAILSKTGAAQSTTVLALGTPVTLATNSWAPTVTATADTTNGGLNLSFTPPVGNTDTIHVVARVESVEVQ